MAIAACSSSRMVPSPYSPVRWSLCPLTGGPFRRRFPPPCPWPHTPGPRPSITRRRPSAGADYRLFELDFVVPHALVRGREVVKTPTDKELRCSSNGGLGYGLRASI